jgi:inhibitor of KinA sporulation pathway (predicted exonuclease)
MQTKLAALTFGTEFEVIIPAQFSRASAAAELARRIGKTVDSGIGASGRNWKVVNDGSVHGSNGSGLEFVSPYNPPLQGQAGLDEVAKVANALRDMGCTVNTTCGFHVHVGARGSRLDFFKNLVKLYARYEEAIDGIMPQSRRGNGANYCKSISRVDFGKVDRASTVSQISHEIYRSSGAHAPRYHKLNLEAFQKHSTVEFRQHSGTVDAGKATNWIVTCLALVAAAKDGKTGLARAAQIAWDLAVLQGKQRHCASLIARPEGATNEEIRAAFGYRTLSARTNLKKAGLMFREERDRATGKTRFFAVLATDAGGVEPAAPTTLDGLADLIDATPEVKAFFAERRRTLTA